MGASKSGLAGVSGMNGIKKNVKKKKKTADNMRAKNPTRYKKSCEDLERRALGYVPEKRVESVKTGRNCDCRPPNLCPLAATCAAKIWEELVMAQQNQ